MPTGNRQATTYDRAVKSADMNACTAYVLYVYLLK